jgi:phytoene desaturase
MMNYVDFGEGVWYPEGGIHKVIEALEAIAQKYGVTIRTSAPVASIRVEKGEAKGITLENGESIDADIVISNADIEFTDQKLLAKEYREHSPRYWNSRLMAPSALILYLGVDGKLPGLLHHNLVFSENWPENFEQIFKKPTWPTDPSLYVCMPSKTDASVAPAGSENLFVLVPIAAGLDYTEEFVEKYTDFVIQQMQENMQIPDLASRITYKRIYSVKDFGSDYNAFKGTALGMAHSLGQTAIFRPNNINRKVKNLFYVGAGTNPGIGMPTCLISAELAYKRVEQINDPSPLKQL